MKAQKTIAVKKEAGSIGSMFGRENFKWMLIGAAILALGFILMGGGSSNNPNVFDTKQVYSTTRITIAPIVILIGFAVEIYALFQKPKAQ